MNTLYLVRHGENTANLTKEFSYKLIDYSLTPRGVLQAQQTAAYFADLPIDFIYSSPLKRAMETAQMIAVRLNLAVTLIEEFREVNVGLLETQPPTRTNWELHDRIVAGWRSEQPDLTFPGGENYHMLVARIRAGLAQVLQGKHDRKIIIVAHGGVISFMRSAICTRTDQCTVSISEHHNCSITEVVVSDGTAPREASLIRWADNRHLSGDAAQFVVGHPDSDGTILADDPVRIPGERTRDDSSQY